MDLPSELIQSEESTSVDKAIAVLKAFGEDANLGVGVSELSRRAGLSKSTTFRLLGILERNEMIERIGTAYRFGRTIQSLGAQGSDSHHDEVRDVLTPYLTDLYVNTHLTVQLAVLEGRHIVYLNKLEGHQRLRSPSRIGGRMPTYCTAVGKALIAFDPVAAGQALREPRHPWTAATITDEYSLRAELARVRQTGVAHDRGESLATLSCVAAPVLNRRGMPVAALSISGPTESFLAHQHEHTLRQVCFAASRVITRSEERRAV